MSTNAEKRRAAKAKARERRKAAMHVAAQASTRGKQREPDGFALPDEQPAGMDAGGWGMLTALSEFVCSTIPCAYLTHAELNEVRAGMRRRCCTSDMDRAKYDQAYRETYAGIARAQVEQEFNQSPKENN